MTDLPNLDLDFTEQPPIPEAGIERANQLMKSGRLFRYGETESGELDVAALERRFADEVGARYCVALNSCGASLAVALKSAGVKAGNAVLMNAFTLAPVPGSIAHVGAEPVFVGITENYTIDVDDLRSAAARSGARFLLLSHMRGHISDMTVLSEVADELGLTVVEDCAHTMGASWSKKPTGTFGSIGCFSTQTFKHVNSGEGGLLVTDDEDIAARAVLFSGSYMLYEQHGAAPSIDVFERHRLTTPNFSMRMSALAAAVALPQIDLLRERAAQWNTRYAELAARLGSDPRIVLPLRPPQEDFVASSFQFRSPSLDAPTIDRWLSLAGHHGVQVKWFGRPEPLGFTSRFDHWRYATEQSLHTTSQILATLCDLRIPLRMTSEDAATITTILLGTLDAATAS
ncbi:MAG: DegT/DnrJ/EryC1/StrS family aminotransferase [Acidimicrobiales bacterium]